MGTKNAKYAKEEPRRARRCSGLEAGASGGLCRSFDSGVERPTPPLMMTIWVVRTYQFSDGILDVIDDDCVYRPLVDSSLRPSCSWSAVLPPGSPGMFRSGETGGNRLVRGGWGLPLRPAWRCGGG
jgi:hypothetical protein